MVADYRWLTLLPNVRLLVSEATRASRTENRTANGYRWLFCTINNGLISSRLSPDVIITIV